MMWRNQNTNEMRQEQPRTISGAGGITHNPDPAMLRAAGWYPVALADLVPESRVLRRYEYTFDERAQRFDQIAVTEDRAQAEAESDAAIEAERVAQNEMLADTPVMRGILARLTALEKKAEARQ